MKKALAKIARVLGGIILALLSAGSFLLVLGGIRGMTNNGRIIYLLATVICIAVGCGLAKLSLCCFSPPKCDAFAERDYRHLTREKRKK